MKAKIWIDGREVAVMTSKDDPQAKDLPPPPPGPIEISGEIRILSVGGYPVADPADVEVALEDLIDRLALDRGTRKELKP